jgi:hypothetical protein
MTREPPCRDGGCLSGLALPGQAPDQCSGRVMPKLMLGGA